MYRVFAIEDKKRKNLFNFERKPNIEALKRLIYSNNVPEKLTPISGVTGKRKHFFLYNTETKEKTEIFVGHEFDGIYDNEEKEEDDMAKEDVELLERKIRLLREDTESAITRVKNDLQVEIKRMIDEIEDYDLDEDENASLVESIELLSEENKTFEMRLAKIENIINLVTPHLQKFIPEFKV